eukprot:GILJ01012740.1.p1 GENE.GILJ01012740.1~~GILJ01012740.1.p1  ORF type:complete len:1910 (+),score=305.17 GILJ01012740.1:792-5732(+)
MANNEDLKSTPNQVISARTPSSARARSAYQSQEPQFSPGQFSCERQHVLYLPIHERLQPSQAIKNIATTSLHAFEVSNRVNVFVIREKTNAIFYLRLLEGSMPKGSAQISAQDKSIQPNPAPTVTPTPTTPTTPSTPPLPHLSNRSGSASRTSFADTATSSSSSARSVATSYLIMEVYGVGAADPETIAHMNALLENRLANSTLSILSKLLHRNPQFKLNPGDVEFIRPAGTTPSKAVSYELPPFIKDPYCFLQYLKQNLQRFLHLLHLAGEHGILSPSIANTLLPETPTNAKGTSESTAGDATPEPARTVEISSQEFTFVYNYVPSNLPASSSNVTASIGKGIAFVYMSLLDGTGKVVHSLIRPLSQDVFDDLPYQLWSEIVGQDIPVDCAPSMMAGNGSTGSNVSSTVHEGPWSLAIEVWHKGHLNLGALFDKITLTISQSIHEYVIESLLVCPPSTKSEEEKKITAERVFSLLTQVFNSSVNLSTPSVHELRWDLLMPCWVLDDLLVELNKLLVSVTPFNGPLIFRTEPHRANSYIPYQPTPTPALTSSTVPVDSTRTSDVDRHLEGFASIPSGHVVEHGVIPVFFMATGTKGATQLIADLLGLQQDIRQPLSRRNSANTAEELISTEPKHLSENLLFPPLNVGSTATSHLTVMRHMSILISINGRDVTLYTYNVHTQVLERINDGLNKLLQWIRLRLQFLSNVLNQKMGLFYHTGVEPTRVLHGSPLIPSTSLSATQHAAKSLDPITVDQVDELIQRRMFQLPLLPSLQSYPSSSSITSLNSSFADAPGSSRNSILPSMTTAPLTVGRSNSLQLTPNLNKVTPALVPIDSMLKGVYPKLAESSQIQLMNRLIHGWRDPVQRHGSDFEVMIKNQISSKHRITSPSAKDTSNTLSAVFTMTTSDPTDHAAASTLLQHSRVVYTARAPLLLIQASIQVSDSAPPTPRPPNGSNAVSEPLTRNSTVSFDSISSRDVRSIDGSLDITQLVLYRRLVEIFMQNYIQYLQTSLSMQVVSITHDQDTDVGEEGDVHSIHRDSVHSRTTGATTAPLSRSVSTIIQPTVAATDSDSTAIRRTLSTPQQGAKHQTPSSPSSTVEPVNAMPRVPSGSHLNRGTELVRLNAMRVLLSKTVNTSTLLMEIGFKDLFVHCNLYANETTCSNLNSAGSPQSHVPPSYGSSPSYASHHKSVHDSIRLCSEIHRMQTMLHTDSFIYDFHLRHIFMYLALTPAPEYPTFDLRDVLAVLDRYYPDPPVFARNTLISSQVSIDLGWLDCPSLSAQALFEYLCSRAEKYGWSNLESRGAGKLLVLACPAPVALKRAAKDLPLRTVSATGAYRAVVLSLQPGQLTTEQCSQTLHLSLSVMCVDLDDIFPLTSPSSSIPALHVPLPFPVAGGLQRQTSAGLSPLSGTQTSPSTQRLSLGRQSNVSPGLAALPPSPVSSVNTSSVMSYVSSPIHLPPLSSSVTRKSFELSFQASPARSHDTTSDRTILLQDAEGAVREAIQLAATHFKRDRLWERIRSDNPIDHNDLDDLLVLSYCTPVEALDPGLDSLFGIQWIDWALLAEHLASLYGDRLRQVVTHEFIHLLCFSFLEKNLLLHVQIRKDGSSLNLEVVKPSSEPCSDPSAEPALISRVVNFICHWLWRGLVHRP